MDSHAALVKPTQTGDLLFVCAEAGAGIGVGVGVGSTIARACKGQVDPLGVPSCRALLPAQHPVPPSRNRDFSREHFIVKTRSCHLHAPDALDTSYLAVWQRAHARKHTHTRSTNERQQFHTKSDKHMHLRTNIQTRQVDQSGGFEVGPGTRHSRVKAASEANEPCAASRAGHLLS